MDAALDISASTGVRVCLVLVDFAWIDDPVRRARARIDGVHRSRARSVSRSLRRQHADPFARRHQRARLGDRRPRDRSEAWRVAARASAKRSSALRRSASTRDRRRSSRSAADRCDSRESGTILPMVSTSSRSIRIPTCAIQDRDETVFGSAAADFGLSKPLLIGECPSRSARASRRAPVAGVHARRLSRARARGRLSRRLAVELQGRRCVRRPCGRC